jgi:hypothetical protein
LVFIDDSLIYFMKYLILIVLLFSHNIIFSQGSYILSASTTLKPSGAIYLVYGGGTLTNNSSYTDAAGTVIFTDAVTYTGSGTTSLNNLTINQASGTSVLNIPITLTGTVDLTSGNLNANGNLTIAPGASVVGNYANISGNVILQQNISAQRGWRMFAHPFTTTQTFAGIAGNNGISIQTTGSSNAAGISDARVFNNASNSWGDAGSSAAANTAYGLFIRGLSGEVTGLNYTNGPTAFTYSVTGQLNGNSTTVTASNVSGNFAVVGNPYAAPVKTIALTGGISKPYYVYQISQGANTTAQRTKAGSWSAVMNSSATTTIPVLGVIAYQPSSSSYNVTNADILTGGSLQTGLFGTEDPIPHVAVQLERNGVYQDKLFVRLDHRATEPGNDPHDLQKFMNEVSNIYSITTDGVKMAIDARNELKNIPMGIQTPAGDYAFKLSRQSLPDGMTAILHDKFLNKYQDIETGSVYPFSINSDPASQGSQRFEINFSRTKVSAMTGESEAGLFRLYPNPTQSVVQVQLPAEEGEFIISLMDVEGRMLSNINGKTGQLLQIPLNDHPAGSYIIQVTNGSKTSSKKFLKIQ